MKRRIGIAALAAGFFVVATGQVSAQSGGRNCGARDIVVDRLAESYGETRQSMGLGANNQIIEVFASSETGTWTITVTMPNGMTCLVASGQAFEVLTEDLTPTGMAL